MSLSSALSNALSGLTVSSRAADVVASNIANAMTDGYGVRDVDIAARVTGNAGAGARVVGVARFEDPVVSGARRAADAELAQSRTGAEALTRLEALIGTPDQADSLSARSAAFEAGLTAAAAAPQNDAQLAATADAAKALVSQINGISDGIQAERLRADRQIADAVTLINTTLVELDDLNTQIRTGTMRREEVASLLDAQAQRLDQISTLIPLMTRRDEYGALQVYSQDGEALLDGRPAQLGFTPAATVTPDLAIGAGLSGLTLNGRDITLGGNTGRLARGELSALFNLRDTTMVGAQTQIDAVARDLIQRFEAPGLDPTRGVGAPGLFTDGGLSFLASAENGLAGRLRLNAAVDPAQGGVAWRLRDGLGAAAPGPVGQSALLRDQIAVLSTAQPTASGGFSATSRSFATLVADHVSEVGVARQSAETTQTGIAGRHTALREAELARGVDTDAQMQRLLQIEQAYAANARVITAADEMFDQLLRIG